MSIMNRLSEETTTNCPAPVSTRSPTSTQIADHNLANSGAELLRRQGLADVSETPNGPPTTKKPPVETSDPTISALPRPTLDLSPRLLCQLGPVTEEPPYTDEGTTIWRSIDRTSYNRMMIDGLVLPRSELPTSTYTPREPKGAVASEQTNSGDEASTPRRICEVPADVPRGPNSSPAASATPLSFFLEGITDEELANAAAELRTCQRTPRVTSSRQYTTAEITRRILASPTPAVLSHLAALPRHEDGSRDRSSRSMPTCGDNNQRLPHPSLSEALAAGACVLAILCLVRPQASSSSPYCMSVRFLGITTLLVSLQTVAVLLTTLASAQTTTSTSAAAPPPPSPPPSSTPETYHASDKKVIICAVGGALAVVGLLALIAIALHMKAVAKKRAEAWAELQAMFWERLGESGSRRAGREGGLEEGSRVGCGGSGGGGDGGDGRASSASASAPASAGSNGAVGGWEKV